MAVASLTSASARTGTATALPVAVVGLGAYLPDQIWTNDDWAARLDTSDEWIRTRTGIRARHVAAPAQATSDLALAASTAALADAGIEASALGAVVVATTTPDHAIPGTAPLVAAGLGIETAAFDLNAACSGFVYGLRTAGAMAATGQGPILLVGAETLTRVIDPTDRGVAVLFGDGAGACVLAADDHASFGPFDAGADGTLARILCSSASGTRTPISPAGVAAGEQFLRMDGPTVYRHAVTRMAASSLQVLQDAGLTAADVDLFVGHQANARILEGVARRVGIDDAQVHMTVDRHGNTSAASIPLALADARATGRLQPGMRVLLTAFGAGVTWASCLLTWGSSGPTRQTADTHAITEQPA